MKFHPDVWNTVNAEFEVHDQAGVGNVTLYWDDTPYPGPGQYNASSVTCSLVNGASFTQVECALFSSYTYGTVTTVPSGGSLPLTPCFANFIIVSFGQFATRSWRAVITDPNGCKL